MKTFFSLYPMSNFDRWSNIMNIMAKQSSKTRNSSSITSGVINEEAVSHTTLRKSLTGYISNFSWNKIISGKVK